MTTVAFGQAGETDVGEVSGYGGGAFGIGSHAFVGAGTGTAFSRYALAVVDMSYSRFGHDTLRYLPGLTVQGSNVYDVNASLHVRFPINERWAPYGIVGPSVIWNGYQYLQTTPSGPAWISRTDVNFGFHTGAGVRYHVNENWGLRPEVRVVISNQTYVTFSLGVFFNL